MSVGEEEEIERVMEKGEAKEKEVERMYLVWFGCFGLFGVL